MSVIFRSLRAKHIRRGDSKELMRLSGSDWSSLRGYGSSDDARDIVWRKSTNTNQIYTKERQDNGSFSVMVIRESSAGDLFSYDDTPSRERFYDIGLDALRKSAHIGGHSYREFSSFTELIKTKPKNALILIFSSSLEGGIHERLKLIAPFNDIIFLHTFHPFELSGEGNILFNGKTVKDTIYKIHFEKARKNIQESIIKLHGEYIKITTDEDIEKRLNYFFNNRFRHG